MVHKSGREKGARCKEVVCSLWITHIITRELHQTSAISHNHLKARCACTSQVCEANCSAVCPKCKCVSRPPTRAAGINQSSEAEGEADVGGGRGERTKLKEVWRWHHVDSGGGGSPTWWRSDHTSLLNTPFSTPMGQQWRCYWLLCVRCKTLMFLQFKLLFHLHFLLNIN